MRFRTLRMTHQTKFVMKPPASTTMSTGRFCHSSLRSDASSCARVICASGAPAVSPYAKHALMIPQNVATSMPFAKLNSGTAARFSAADSSRSLDTPARPLTAIPIRDTRTPARMTRPDRLPTMASKSPLTIGGRSVPKALHRPSATATPSAMPR